MRGVRVLCTAERAREKVRVLAATSHMHVTSRPQPRGADEDTGERERGESPLALSAASGLRVHTR